jgi:Flp pilus assembly protein TadB
MHAAELWHQLGAIDRVAAALAGLAFGATLLTALWELARARRARGEVDRWEPAGRHRAGAAFHQGVSRRTSYASTRSPDRTETPPRRPRRRGAALLATLAIVAFAGALPLLLLLR